MLRRSLLSRKERKIYSLSAAKCKPEWLRDTGTGNFLVACAIQEISPAKFRGWIEGIAHIALSGHSFIIYVVLDTPAGRVCDNIHLSVLRRYSRHIFRNDAHIGLCHAIRTATRTHRESLREAASIIREMQLYADTIDWRELFAIAVSANLPRAFRLLTRMSGSNPVPIEIFDALKRGQTRCLRLEVPVGTESSSPATRRRLNDLFRDLITNDSARGVRALLRAYDSRAFDFESGTAYATRSTKAFEIMKLIFEKALACNRKFDLLLAISTALRYGVDPRVHALIQDWAPKIGRI